MNDIKFSVAITVYKNDKVEFVKEALDSLINQTKTPNEIVLLCDGPIPNDIDNFLRDYENKYSILKVYRNEQNKGLGLALRDCVSYCQYDYIARMDSDDISAPSRFEKQINHLVLHQKIYHQ